MVILRTETNRGAAWNYNRVFEGCATPYFKWAAADDVLAPTCVERCLDVLKAAPPSVVLAFPRTRVIDDNSEPIGELIDALSMRPEAPVHARFRQVVANVLWGNLVFALMRTDALRRTRLHGSYPSSDHVLLAELALIGSFVEVPELLFFRRQHAGMSRLANPSPVETTQWFDPTAVPVTDEFSRVFHEHLVAIDQAELTPSERRRVRAMFFATWGLRRARLNPYVMLVRSVLQVRTWARRVAARFSGRPDQR
jgi:hypothetical protein